MALRRRLAWQSSASALLLAALLPFLSFFDSYRNIELQGGVLIVAGGLATLTLCLHPEIVNSLSRPYKILLSIYVSTCLLSATLNPHSYYNWLGAPYIRLGALGLLSCAALGLIARTVPLSRILLTLYTLIATLAVAAIPFSLWRFGSLARIGGMFAQADIMACFMGCGILLGWFVRKERLRHRYLIAVCQLLLITILLLTQTRAVIGLTLLLSGIILLQGNGRQSCLRQRYVVFAGITAVIMIWFVLPNRVTSLSYGGTSLSYRAALQSAGLHASMHHPLLGYGPGNLADALDCRGLHAPALRKTCAQHYFFNSSHNIFLDRILALGWLGGLAFLGLTVTLLAYGMRQRDERLAFALVALLIACYYLTNVTAVPLEALFWVMLWLCLPPQKKLLDKA